MVQQAAHLQLRTSMFMRRGLRLRALSLPLPDCSLLRQISIISCLWLGVCMALLLPFLMLLWWGGLVFLLYEFELGGLLIDLLLVLILVLVLVFVLVLVLLLVNMDIRLYLGVVLSYG